MYLNVHSTEVSTSLDRTACRANYLLEIKFTNGTGFFRTGLLQWYAALWYEAVRSGETPGRAKSGIGEWTEELTTLRSTA
jgi:hypothetical protein